MSTKRDGKGRRRAVRRPGFSVEALERRALLTASSETFIGPSLTGLISQAEHGKDTTPALIGRMLNALESQLRVGPLADLDFGTVDHNGFVAEAQGLETSFEQDVNQLFLAKFPDTDEILNLEGRRVVAELAALNQQDAVGLISGADLAASSQSAIASLTAGPIRPLGTSLATMTATSKAFRSELYSLTDGLGNGSLTLDQVATTLGAEAEAYRAEVHSAVQVDNLRISGETDTDINALEGAAGTIALADPSDARAQLSAAIDTFVGSVLDTTGSFGPRGAYSRAPKIVTEKPTATTGQATSIITGVSGTTGNDGTATLTATLTSADGSPIAGQVVAFTLDGAFAGVGVTDFVGVATVTKVATADAVGTDTGGVVASFASDTNFLPSGSIGNLTVNVIPVATALSGVNGIADSGGTATLNATLSTAATGQAIAGQSVNFTLDGTAVGSAVTGSNGVASLTGVATTDAIGTDAGGVVASYGGSTNDAATANAAGNLVVSEPGATLSSVTGTAQLGGTAILDATLTSDATGLGIAGETVNFTLDGTAVGSAVTDSSGVASLAGVATTDAIGTDTGGVVASFAGNTSFAAATATGNLVVSQATTTVGNVAGTAIFGGTATLTATLTSAASVLGIPGETVSFTLDGVAVGTATTNSNGVATLTGVATTDSVGTNTGDVVASFAGDTDYLASENTGNLTVS